MEQNDLDISERYAQALRDLTAVNTGVLQALADPGLTPEQLQELHHKYVKVVRMAEEIRQAYELWEAEQTRVLH